VNIENIKALARSLNRTSESLLAQTAWTDPFYVFGTREEAARWVAETILALDPPPPRPFHSRRIHYRLVSHANVRKPDGNTYDNIIDDWRLLKSAIRDAVYLELLPGEAIVDHRSEEPICRLRSAEDGEIRLSAPWLFSEMPDLPRLRIDDPQPAQPVHVEILIEKSTQNDILEPLAERYGINIVPGTGEISSTRCREIVARARQNGSRPVRILYVSDFDPAGQDMPVSAARKIEYEIDKLGLRLDIQLRHVALTAQQCIDYRLPRIPTKETDKRVGRFEQNFGAGQTELDALEALHPGTLEQILVREIKRYHDPDLTRRHHAKNRRRAGCASRIERLVYGRFQRELTALRADYETWLERARPLYQNITQRLERVERRLSVPVSDFVADEDPDPLFDSTRSYVDQIDRYKAHQGKEIAKTQHTYVCQQCGSAFEARRKTARFCSKSCNDAARRSACSQGHKSSGAA
jgi:hypothetical protein